MDNEKKDYLISSINNLLKSMNVDELEFINSIVIYTFTEDWDLLKFPMNEFLNEREYKVAIYRSTFENKKNK